jgi:uncharacterized protein YmfQ (DUF2313 family)
MGLVAADYFRALKALLPFGPAWDLDNDSMASKQIDAWSQEFARVQARADALGEEADPRITYELLPDYERIFGLPTDCMSGVNQTLQQRHNALVSQMTSVGGQSRQYFIDLAAAAGFAITITEFTPFTVGMTVADPLYGTDWRFAWQVNASLNTVTHFTVASGVNEALGTWGNNLLECLINRYKPAHTIAIFSYT